VFSASSADFPIPATGRGRERVPCAGSSPLSPRTSREPRSEILARRATHREPSAYRRRRVPSHGRDHGDFRGSIASGGRPTDNDRQGRRAASSAPRTRMKRAPPGRAPRDRPRTRQGRRHQEPASTAHTLPTPQRIPLAIQRTRRRSHPTVARASVASCSITVCYAPAHARGNVVDNPRDLPARLKTLLARRREVRAGRVVFVLACRAGPRWSCLRVLGLWFR
jgi:hypothetical protein